MCENAALEIRQNVSKLGIPMTASVTLCCQCGEEPGTIINPARLIHIWKISYSSKLCDVKF